MKNRKSNTPSISSDDITEEAVIFMFLLNQRGERANKCYTQLMYNYME